IMRATAAIPDRARAESRTSGLMSFVISIGTAVVILAVALLLLITPIWTHFALSASGATSYFEAGQAFNLSDATIVELVAGPGTFSAFSADEAGHMRDVRAVLLAFLVAAAMFVALIALTLTRASGDARAWRALARGGLVLALGLVVLGVFAALAFGVAFELFHRLLFPGGNWSFPEGSLLITLYPYGFWQLSAAAFAVLSIGAGLIVWFVARRRSRALARGADA
ncbi:MAG: DUF1461 domain-containing protein, partial [Candidatus Limnocylindrales bacterium]